MKKISTFTMALATGLVAMAAPKVATTDKAMSLQQFSAESMEQLSGKVMTENHSAPAKAVSQISDLYGLYQWNAEGLLGSGDWREGPQTFSVTFEANEANPTTAIDIVGFPWPDPDCVITANVDMVKRTVTINKQGMGVSNSSGELQLYPAQYNSSSKSFSPVDRFIGTFDENGVITFQQGVYFAVQDAGWTGGTSFYALWGDCSFTPLQFTEINLNDYVYKGVGTFTDGWFNPLLNNQIEESPVAIYTSPDCKIVVLKDPYGSAPWLQSNLLDPGETGDGYIVIDVEDPEFACVMPMVKSGMVFSEDGEKVSYLPFNSEGMLKYSYGDSEDYADMVADMKDEYDILGEDLSKLEGDVITIANGYFGIDSNPLSDYFWSAGQGQLMDFPGAVVNLPAGWNETGGVTNAAVDSKAPVKFYNLQGMEIAAPVKGQINVRVQGNETVKFIGK